MGRLSGYEEPDNLGLQKLTYTETKKDGQIATYEQYSDGHLRTRETYEYGHK